MNEIEYLAGRISDLSEKLAEVDGWLHDAIEDCTKTGNNKQININEEERQKILGLMQKLSNRLADLPL